MGGKLWADIWPEVQLRNVSTLSRFAEIDHRAYSNVITQTLTALMDYIVYQCHIFGSKRHSFMYCGIGLRRPNICEAYRAPVSFARLDLSDLSLKELPQPSSSW